MCMDAHVQVGMHLHMHICAYGFMH
jgi:hypothetical protein